MQVELLVQQSGGSPYRVNPEMASAMMALIAENPTSDPGRQTLALGQGTWEVRLMMRGCKLHLLFLARVMYACDCSCL